MAEPVKPFACNLPDCGMSFTNEDHLNVHTKKHDMVLQLGLEQKSAFVADQTPTPTRFIRNCEEVGLFQDLQNVAANPFDEGFKRAMEAKAGVLSLESVIAPASDDVLHTPQMVFPLIENGEPTLYNAQRNITISRSFSDETAAIKEFDTRAISKLSNEVTTISRVVNTDDVTKQTDIQKDFETVSYKNNVWRMESNVVNNVCIRKDAPVLTYLIKETSTNTRTDNFKPPNNVPIMSQKSIDLVVDSLTAETQTHSTQTRNPNKLNRTISSIRDDHKAVLRNRIKKPPITPKQPKILPKHVPDNKTTTNLISPTDGYEVVIKLPNGKQVRMKPVEDDNTKEVLRNKLTEKATKPSIKVLDPKVLNRNFKKPVNIPTGTLIPVTLVNQEGAPLTNNDLNKVPITKINHVTELTKFGPPVYKIGRNGAKLVKKKLVIQRKIVPIAPKFNIKVSEPFHINTEEIQKPMSPNKSVANEIVSLTEEDNLDDVEERTKEKAAEDDDCVVIEDDEVDVSKQVEQKRQKIDQERRSEASKRYRERLKCLMQKQADENRLLREANQRLIAEKAVLKLLITEHMKQCPNASEMANRLTIITNGETIEEMAILDYE